jgi:hypothetical protein
VRSKACQLTVIALLAAFITVTGMAKTPGLIPGTEFQLSAPLAVAICAAFGFTHYMLVGLLSSFIGLMLGLQNVINVFIASIFRLTVGLVMLIFGTDRPVIIVAGPLGSVMARLAMSLIIDKAAGALVLAALPGMIYTGLASWPLTRLLQRIKKQTEKVSKHAV